MCRAVGIYTYIENFGTEFMQSVGYVGTIFIYVVLWPRAVFYASWILYCQFHFNEKGKKRDLKQV